MLCIKFKIPTLLILLTSILFTSNLVAKSDVVEGDTYFFGIGFGYYSISDNLKIIQVTDFSDTSTAYENKKDPGAVLGTQISFGKKYSDNFAFELSLMSINSRTVNFYKQSCSDASGNTISECTGDMNFEMRSGDIILMQFIPVGDFTRYYYGLGAGYTYYTKTLILSGNGLSHNAFIAKNSKLGLVGKLGIQLNKTYDFSLIIYPYIGNKESVGQGYAVGVLFKYTVWE